jgi:hypothetical protein
VRIEWRHFRKPAPLLAILALVLFLLALAFRGWDSYVEDGLSRWAVGELATQTDSTYRLSLGDLSFLPLAGSISFDSAAVTTDLARNRRRPAPLPALNARAQECRVTGLDLVRLALGKAFNARTLECRSVAAHVGLPGGTKPRPDTRVSGLGISPPLGLSSLRLAHLSLPSFRLSLERPGARGPASVVLERARFEAAGLDLGRGSGSAERARLQAGGVMLRPDTLIELAVDSLDAELTDSTLSLIGVRHEPTVPEAEWIRRMRVRRDRIRFALDSLQARGVAYRAFLASGAIAIRAMELRGPRLDVLSDQRMAPGPPRRRRTPQQVASQARSALRLDTMLVRAGTIVYRERKPKTERPGVVTFEQVRATILHLDLPSRGEPLRIAASARLMGEGPLTARATVPLDAPDFRYELSGRLGRMPAKALNRFLAVNEAYQFDDGTAEEVTFTQTVRGGRAVTVVTPRYRDLSVEPSGEGGGVVGSVGREIKDFIAGAFVVRSSNPDDDGEHLRRGRTIRRYSPQRTWLQFIWFGLRDGLQAVMKE